MLLSSEDAFRMNPMHHGFEMLARAQGKDLLEINATTAGGYRVHGFAARNGTAVTVYLMNKFEVAQKVQLTFLARDPGLAPGPASGGGGVERGGGGVGREGGGPLAGLTWVDSLVNSTDGWGAVVRWEPQSKWPNGMCFLLSVGFAAFAKGPRVRRGCGEANEP